MFANKSILAIIPARGGSKSIPKKNLSILGGKTLLSRTIETAKKSRYIDRLILSSENKEIIDIAKKCDCEVPFVRPKELAQDHSPGIDPIIHAIKFIDQEYDYILVLQCTSPFRTVDDIDECIELCIYQNVVSCVSVVEVTENPYWMYTLSDKKYLNKLIDSNEEIYQRQILPDVYRLNGAIYFAETQMVLKNKTFLGPQTIGYKMSLVNSLDIDEDIDLEFARFLIEKKRD